jgi:putative flavoprotein involved in K+ transport
MEDGAVMDVANVIWCTGFNHGMDWLDVDVFDEQGQPRHRSGICDEIPGLYFVGLHVLHALSSTMIHGVGRDAKRVASAIAATDRGNPRRSSGPRGSATNLYL